MNKLLVFAAVENSSQFKYIALFLKELLTHAKPKFVMQKVTVQFDKGNDTFVEDLNCKSSKRNVLSQFNDFWKSKIEITPSQGSIYDSFKELCSETHGDGDKLLILVFDFRNNGSGFRGSDRNKIVNELTNKLTLKDGHPLNIKYYAQFIYVNKNASDDMSCSYDRLQSTRGENGLSANIGCYDVLRNSNESDVEQIDNAVIKKFARSTLNAFINRTK